MGCNLIGRGILFIICFLLVISIVNAVAIIELSTANPNPGETLRITIKPSGSGYLNKLYFYDSSNQLVDVEELVCDNGRRICYNSQIFSYTIPNNWRGQYYIAVYDYSIHDYAKKIFSVGFVKTLSSDYVSVASTSVSYTFPRGWNLISLPLQPDDPNPSSVFDVNDINFNLHRYDIDAMGYISYSIIAPSRFGNISVEQGYWLYCWDSAGCTASYSGSDAPDLISLNLAGWHLIGVPSVNDVYVNDIQVEHNGQIRSIAEAATGADKWIELPFKLYVQETNGYLNIGPAGMGTIWDDNYLYPWYGYWIKTLVNDVTLKLSATLGFTVSNNASATYQDSSGRTYAANSNTVDVEVIG